MDKVAKKYKRQLKKMEYVERFFRDREDREITVAEYTDFDHSLREIDHVDYYDHIEY
jgi:hypothetical protein